MTKTYNIFIKKKKICTYTVDYGRISVLITATFFKRPNLKVNAPKYMCTGKTVLRSMIGT